MRRRKKRRRIRWRPPELTLSQILGWADALHERTGRWPRKDFGRISGALGEKWSTVDNALKNGLRGLTGGSSLARLLAKHRGVRNPKGLPPFTVEQILAWADAYHERTGRWPALLSGPISEAPGETWSAVQSALRNGKRGFPGGSSLARLLAAQRHVRNIHDLRDLTCRQILRWTDAYRCRTGEWPTMKSGPIPEVPGETWNSVDRALRGGSRGLPARSSLARLLAERRGVRNPKGLPPLTVEQILAWADAHRARTGQWPTLRAGLIPEAPGEDWARVDNVLRKGLRSLPGSSSLARLLAQKRGVRNIAGMAPLTVEQILSWADAHYRRTKRWPTTSILTVIPGSIGEKWSAIDIALQKGCRGLPGGSSLPRLLAEQRSVRNKMALPCLTDELILAWADAFHKRTGKWPKRNTSPTLIPGSRGEKWSSADDALRRGLRSLRGGSSLARLLAERRGVRNIHQLPRLTVKQILAWADAYHARTGQWPKQKIWSEAIPGSHGETWLSVFQALKLGLRGLPGGSSLADLLARRRGVRNVGNLSSLTVKQILAWADAYHERTGNWPRRHGSPQIIEGSFRDRWSDVDRALRRGFRGLPGGSSLSQLLAQQRGVRRAINQTSCDHE